MKKEQKHEWSEGPKGNRDVLCRTMKIICIGRNYIDHASELGNPVPSEPMFFLKPDSSILHKRHAFYIPDWTKEVHYEVELVVKIKKLGKAIQKNMLPATIQR